MKKNRNHIFKLLKYCYKWCTKTKLRKILSSTLAILILLTSIRFLFLKPKVVLADTYIPMDEGYGTTSAVHDVNGNVSAGTSNDGLWKQEDLCVQGKCLYFDGATSTIEFSDDPDLDFAAADDFTIEGWFRHPVISGSSNLLIFKYQNSVAGGYQIYMDSDGDIVFGIDDDGTWDSTDIIGDDQSKNFDDNQWHHFAAQKDGTTGIYLYVDGNLIDQDTTITETGTLANSSPLDIGSAGDDSFWSGFIDEIKIYRSLRTTTEIKADILGGTSSRGTSASFGPNQSVLSNGLIGYWNNETVTAGGATNGGPTKIDDVGDPGGQSGERQVVRTSSGTLYAWIHDSGACEIWKSSNGSTWTEQDTANNPSCGSAGDVAIDSTDVIHLTYKSGFALIYVTFASSSDTFGTPATLFTSPDDLYSSSIAIDSNNIPHVFFTSDEFNGSGYDSYAQYINKVGGSWNSAILVDATSGPAGGQFGNTAITISEDNVPEVAYYGVSLGLNASVGNQNNATAFTNKSVDASGLDDLSIGIDSSGNTWIAYDGSSYITLVKHNDADAWTTWQTPVNNTQSGSSPSIVNIGTDTYVFFIDSSSDIVFDMYSGSSWTDPTTLHIGTFTDIETKWSYYNDNQQSTQTDYLFSDGTDVYWASLGIGGSSTVSDSSGNGYSLTNNGSTTFTAGKFGSAPFFDGGTKYFNSASTISNVQTVSFWFNSQDTSSDGFINLASGVYIRASSTLSVNGFTNATTYVNGVQTSTIASAVWSHVVVTGTAPISASAFEVGRANGVYGAVDSQIDEVRLYNRVLSPAEVQKLYNWAPGPVGHWKMDENTGTSAYDSSTNGNTGTITAGSGSFRAGKFGSAYYFDNASTIINAGTGTTLDNLPSTGMSLSAWIYPISQGEGSAGVIMAKNVGTTPSAGWLFQMAGTNALTFTVDGSTDLVRTTSNNVITTNTWNHVEVSWEGAIATASGVRIYVNGTEVSYATTTNGASRVDDGTSTFYIGNNSTSARTFDGLIDDAKVYNYARSSAQVVEDMNAGHPAPGSPVGSAIGNWHFDEGYGDTANNSGSGATDFDLAGSCPGAGTCPSWTNSGKFEKGLSFDGGDYASIATASDADYDFNGTDKFTVSAWIYTTSMPGSGEYDSIINKWDGTSSQEAYGLAVSNDDGDSTGFISAAVYDKSADQMINAVSPADGISQNTWYHVLMTFNGGIAGTAGDLKLYINGKYSAQNSANASFAGLEDASSDLTVGDWDPNDANATFTGFVGTIDEIKIYNSELNSEQVKVEYNKGVQNLMGATSTDSSGNPTWSAENEYCPPGQGSTCTAPVGEWKFDEKTGTTVNDTSSNSANGTLNGAVFAVGKHGTGVRFTADTDDITFSSTNVSSTAGTFSFWYKPRNNFSSAGTQVQLLGRGNGAANDFYLLKDGTSFYWGINAGADQWLAISSATISPYWVAETWVYFTAVYDITNDDLYLYADGNLISSNTSLVWTTWTPPSTWYIGSHGTDWDAEGIIDDVKIYNYARTQSQIVWDMNRGAPVAHWKMDENSGTSTNDSSGNGYNSSTFTGNTTWTTGKFNTGLTFDGTDDNVRMVEGTKIDLGALTDSYSISAWFKTNVSSPGNNRCIVAKDAGGGTYPFKIVIDGSDKIATWTSANSGTTLSKSGVIDNVWHNIVFIRDVTADTLSAYLDGASIGTITDSAVATLANNDDVSMGACGTSYLASDYNGQVDDVRIYNYPINAQQIKLLYNAGNAVRFAPLTGSP